MLMKENTCTKKAFNEWTVMDEWIKLNKIQPSLHVHYMTDKLKIYSWIQGVQS